MSSSVIILCRDQQDFVNYAIAKLCEQTVLPRNIIVVDDGSIEPFYPIVDTLVTVIRNEKPVGRARGRNLGINRALTTGNNYLIFFDGDSFPADKYFIENYEKAFSEHSSDCVSFYGMREHIQRPLDFGEFLKDSESYSFKPIMKMPSSFLNSNNDNLYDNLYFQRDLDYEDYRDISGIVDLYGKMTSFNEKIDLILTGRITWSCNFAIDVHGIEAVNKINDYQFYFDDTEFKSWGHEDVAFGVDSMFAGVDCRLIKNTYIKHFLHERAPEDTVVGRTAGRHKIMNRYRRLLTKKMIIGP